MELGVTVTVTVTATVTVTVGVLVTIIVKVPVKMASTLTLTLSLMNLQPAFQGLWNNHQAVASYKHSLSLLILFFSGPMCVCFEAVTLQSLTTPPRQRSAPLKQIREVCLVDSFC